MRRARPGAHPLKNKVPAYTCTYLHYQSSEVIVDEKRVWTSAEVRGWSATRELVSVQEGSNTVPISDAIWREIQRGWDESTDSDIDTDGEDGDLCWDEWDDY